MFKIAILGGDLPDYICSIDGIQCLIIILGNYIIILSSCLLSVLPTKSSF